MAAPMREGAAHPANFEYDDNEWDIGIGDLIIDLDADIEKTDEAGGMAARAEPDAQRTALKMKIKRTKPGTKSSEAKHEIVKSNEANGEARAVTPPGAPQQQPAAVKRGSGAHRRDKTRDKHHHHDLNGVGVGRTPADLPAAAPPTTPATPATDPEPAVSAPPPGSPATPAVTTTAPAPSPAPPPPPAAPPKPEPDDSRQDSPGQPPQKKLKSEPKETADICVGTSVGTITEPDCMGPCEPGSSVTLEGIVWHEMEGMLVVNVTWRGKTYVGTLLDCTRHDWAPPRFCDSPLEEFDARTPKGRAKRGRGAAPSDLANFTETRSSVHSKLRNGGAKGRRALPSPTPFTPPRPDPKRKRPSETDDRPPTPKPKRPAPTSPPPEPALLECPEPNCSKKYKHLNGLKYHRSHAHGYDSDDKEGSCSEQEETPASPVPVEPAAPPPPPTAAPCPAPGPAPCPAPPPPPSDEDKSPDKPESEAPSPARPPDEPSSAAPPPPATPPAPATPRAPTPDAPPSPAQFKPHRRDAPIVPAEDELPSLRRLALQVKPRSALMPADERKSTESPPDESPSKRRRRSPTPGARSPAYSDISDDAAPSDAGPDVPEPDHRPPFPVYHQYYGQPSYLPHQLPQTHTVDKGKDDMNKGDHKGDHKDVKPDGAPPKVVPQHFYPYNYVPNFPYNVDTGPGPSPLEDKNKEVDRSKTTASPLDKSGKQRQHDGKDVGSRPNDTHQILKESIEMKSQMGPYGFQRPPPQHARDDELRRYYMSLEQRRKDSGADGKPPGGATAGAGGGKPPPSAPKLPLKDGKDDKGKDEPKVKQEGQKPTTETQGPPPPPTSQYYLPPYMQPPHYFDPVYRAPLSPMLVSGFGGGWAAVPRYHAPEDLSRPAPKLDYYPGGAPHKIHELQEHAKSPAKTHAPPPREHPRDPRDAPPGKDAPRSPPPQRHVHTHHHTHVGLGYPLYPPPYPAAAVLASTQAVVNSFPTPPK